MEEDRVALGKHGEDARRFELSVGVNLSAKLLAPKETPWWKLVAAPRWKGARRHDDIVASITRDDHILLTLRHEGAGAAVTLWRRREPSDSCQQHVERRRPDDRRRHESGEMIAADGRPKRRRHTPKAHGPAKGFRSPPRAARASRGRFAFAVARAVDVPDYSRRRATLPCVRRVESSVRFIGLAGTRAAAAEGASECEPPPAVRATRPTWTRSQFRGRHWMRWIDIRLLCRACVCVLSWCCVGIDKVRHPIDGCHILLRAASRCACAGTTDQRVAMPTAAALSATLIVAALEQRVPTTLQDGSTGRRRRGCTAGPH